MTDGIEDRKPAGLSWLGVEAAPAPIGVAEPGPLRRAANGLAALDAMVVNRGSAQRSTVAAPLRLAVDAVVAVGAVVVSAVVAVGATVVFKGADGGMGSAFADQ